MQIFKKGDIEKSIPFTERGRKKLKKESKKYNLRMSMAVTFIPMRLILNINSSVSIQG